MKLKNRIDELVSMLHDKNIFTEEDLDIYIDLVSDKKGITDRQIYADIVHFKSSILEGLNKEIKSIFTSDNKLKSIKLQGVKESQKVKKAPVFTYCKVNKNAIEALSLRALYGHEKYEEGDDWENFSRVPNGDFEYANSLFRHALEIGEEDEEGHLISSAWNAISRLEIYLRNKK